MTERALLVVPHPALMPQRVGGLTVLERQLWTLKRAGFTQAWVGAQRPADLARLRLPPDLDIRWVEPAVSGETACEPPYVAVSGDHFVRVETLRYVARASYPVAVALEDGSGTTVLQVFPKRSERAVGMPRQPLPAGSTVRLEAPVASGPAERWLLELGNKAADGFMARNFDRHISLAVSRALLDTKVTPNMMTVASSLLGLAGAACFVVPSYGWRLAGALAVWLHSVLDGCDGELSRIRFQESDFGADLDFWGDNLVHLVLFSSIGLGFWRADGSIGPLVAAALACAANAGSAWLNYKERLAKRRDPSRAAALAAASREPGLTPSLSKLEEALAARDFIYLLVVCAYLGRVLEFLWLTAVGSPLFFAMMLYLGGKKSEQVQQPHPPRQGEAGSAAPGHGSGHQHAHSGR